MTVSVNWVPSHGGPCRSPFFMRSIVGPPNFGNPHMPVISRHDAFRLLREYDCLRPASSTKEFTLDRS